jgi:hypothetical protein
VLIVPPSSCQPSSTRQLLSFGAALLLGGCMAGPDYHVPETPVPPDYVEPALPERTDPTAQFDRISSQIHWARRNDW